MRNRSEQPLPNRRILVCKWEHRPDGEIIKDYDEINSNDYKSCYYDSWEYINKNEVKNGK